MLLTLTKKAANWPVGATQKAEELNVRARPARWEDLFKTLQTVIDSDELSDLAAQLVMKFRDLLAQEGLIPVPPLNQSELGPRWQESRNVIERFHTYFRACEKTIAEALGAEAQGRRGAGAQG